MDQEILHGTGAIQRASNSHWDPDTNQVWSPNDKLIESTLQNDPDFNFMGEIQLDLRELHTPNEAGGTQAYVRGEDSISTFRPGARRAHKVKQRQEEEEEAAAAQSKDNGKGRDPDPDRDPESGVALTAQEANMVLQFHHP